MDARSLPALNAALNAASAALLCAGYALIRCGRRDGHKVVMLSAFACSSLFLTSYLAYHWQVGSVRYRGPARPFYLLLLASHVILAIVNLPLILRALHLARHGRFEAHRRLARWVLPSWLYVSVTGVVVYWMLYRLGRSGS